MKTRNVLHLLLLLRILAFFSLICLSSEYSYCIVGKNLDDLIPEDSVVKLFQRWKEKNQKVYNSEEEAQKRLEIFKMNLFYVIEKNANRKSHSGLQIGLNKFADLSNDEFRKQFLSNNQTCHLPGSYRERNFGPCYAPPSLDWRKKGVATSIHKYGANCGSPQVLYSVGALEWIDAIISGELLAFLEQELSTDCDSTNHLHDEDNAEESFEWVVSKSGTDLPGDNNYTGQNDTSTLIMMKSEFDEVEKTSCDLVCAVVRRPIGVCMDASAVDLQLYTGGMYDGECRNNPEDVNHDVLIVGYGSEDGKDYWIVKNLWGRDWGVGGFFYIERNCSSFGICRIHSTISEQSNQQDVMVQPTLLNL